ncbi:MAG TPA: SMC-Scp complex subunit ScpB [Candidatus Aenigmarchaeota archaeon]|nr:SMC-Scp complex subunit ScpB [Candidatus Aenigmarchaeota archaeon]
MEAKKIIEAALFISTRPIMLNELGRLSGIHSLGHVKEILQELQREYEGRGLEIIQTQDGWQMQVRPELLPRVAHLTPYSDLSGGCKRTLALVVFKEPVKQSEIIKIQGNKAYSYIKELIKRGLIKAEKRGHTKILHLTQEFERYFGEEREKIRERMREMVEKGSEPDREGFEEEHTGERSEDEKAGEGGSEEREGRGYTEENPKETGGEKKKPRKERVKVSVGEEKEERKLIPSHSHAFVELE